MTCGKTVLTNNTVINWGTLPFSEGFTLHKYIKITNTLQNASVYLNLNVTGLPNDWSETWNLSFIVMPFTELYPINITSTQPILIRLFPYYYNLTANSTVFADISLWVPANAVGTYNWTSAIQIFPAPPEN
jgi:hypothetical protein